MTDCKIVEEKGLTNSDEILVRCQCGWEYTVVNESFVKGIVARHLTVKGGKYE